MTALAAVLAGSSSALNDVEPGLLGFLVVAALGLALVFLLRSMNKQFKKIGPRPEEPEETDVAVADEARPDEARSGEKGGDDAQASDTGGAGAATRQPRKAPKDGHSGR